MVAGAVRRAVRSGEDTAVPRIVDLWSVVPAALGRVEFDTLEEGNEEEIVGQALRHAILTVWRRYLGGAELGALLARFEHDHLEVETGDLVPAEAVLDQMGERAPGLPEWLELLDVDASSPGAVASAVELVLEGLHLGRRLNKDPSRPVGDRQRYGL